MSGDDAQRAMDPGDPGPKGFQVFLSHSGSEKAFVAQLDKDLRARDVDPFFDEDVEKRCLPIGEKVQDRIFKAIEDCRVGVVILSEDFFTRTVWPMLELEKMVECKKKIMPVFLGISPEQLFNESKLEEWISAWKGLERPGMKINIPKWVGAVKHLREVKGLKLVYRDATGVVKFREEIVKEIRKEARPRFRWDDSHVQGGTRLCKAIQAKISEIRTADEGVQVVGLHGIGGIGKTTACKSLCKDLFSEFDGRVCHIEFRPDSSERGEMERLRKVLQRLTNVDNESLKDKDTDECWKILQEHLASQEPLSSNKVVLVIDNVSVKTRDEVRKYRRLKLDRGSIVMVTARELDELQKINIDSSNCLAMPELVEEEARALFVYYAEPRNGVEERVIMEYVNRCHFGKGDGEGSKHYHPFALRVLGSQMVGKSPLEWKSQLGEEDIFNQLRKEDHPVFSILMWSFDSLRNEDKMLFMDVALFDDGGEMMNLKSDVSELDKLFNSRFIIDPRLSWNTIFEWLSIVHGISKDEVKKRLNVLKKRALLEELGDGMGQIGMHDLWREFAIMETKYGEEEESQWVYEERVSRGERHAKSCMSGGGWEKLRRIFIRESRLGSINFSECKNVTVLRLFNVYVENGVLDLSHLRSIRTLEIVHPGYYASKDDWKDDLQDAKDDHHDSEDDHHDSEDDHHDSEDEHHDSGDYISNSEPIDVEDQKHVKVSGVGQLLNLAALIWLNIDHESMSALEEISRLTDLQILHLKCDYDSNCMSLDLNQLRYLQDVRMEIRGMESISGFSSQMKALRILDLAGCYQLRSCTGVGDVDGLEALLLRGCSWLEELPDLRKLRRLRILDIHGCELLKALPGLGCLGTLQALHGGNACLAMKELPSTSNLGKLEVLDLSRCFELKCVPGLGDLVALRELWVYYCGWLHGLPDEGNLTRLQNVRIYGSNSDDCKAGCRVPGSVLNLALFESVSTQVEIVGVDHELSNLSKLTALKVLELRRCDFERLPHMGSDMILESLWISSCGRLRGWDGVRGLGAGPDTRVDTLSDWTLPFLQYIVVQNCNSLELPDLRHFPQLMHLTLFQWGSIDSMLAKLVVHCHARHEHLQILNITYSGIEELPDLGNFPFLRLVYIMECNTLTNLAISVPLLGLSSLLLRSCRNLRTVPNTNLFPKLTEFSFRQCGVLLNEPEVQKLIASGFRDDGWGTFRREPSSDVVLTPASELNCHADEQAPVDAPNDLAAGPSRLMPCTSEFIPYKESLSEFGKISVPKRALELGSSSGNDQEQTKKHKNIGSSSG